VEAHAGAGGDAEDFFEVMRGAAGEEREGEIVSLSRTAQVVDGLIKVGLRAREERSPVRQQPAPRSSCG
jgi:hypothetical protein